MNKFNLKVIKASIWNITGTFLLKAISLVSVPIFTRLLTQEDYGYVSTYSTYISFMGIIVGVSLNTSIVNARMDYSDRFADFNSSILKAAFIVFAIEIFLANLVSDFICVILNLNRIYLNLVIIISFAEYVVSSYYKINTVDFKFKQNVIFSTANSLFNLTFSVILIFLMENDILGKLVGQSLFLCIMASFFFALIAFKRSNNFEISYILYALKVAIPNIFHQLSQLILAQSDRMMILYFIDAVATAKYSVAYTYALIIQMLWNAINEVWVPWLYRKLKAEDTNTVLKYSGIYINIFSILTILCLLIMPDFMFIMAPESYFDAKDIIVIVILATFFLYLYSFFVNIELYHKKNQYMAVATLIAASINIIGNAITIPVWGYQAAAYTTLGTYIILMLLHYYATTVFLKIKIYTLKFFIPSIISVSFMGMVSKFFLDFAIVRWIITIVIIVNLIIYIFRNKSIINSFWESFHNNKL